MADIWTECAIIPDDGSPALGFPGTMRETHTSTVRLPTHPLDSGGSVNDHVIDEGDHIKISVIVDQWRPDLLVTIPVPIPIPPPTSLIELFSAVPPPTAYVGTEVVPVDHVREMLDALRALKAAGTTCTVFTSCAEYASMALERVELPREDRGKAVFDLTFKPILTANSLLVPAPVPAVPAGAASTSKGATSPAPTTPPGNESFLHSVLQ